MKSEFTKEEDEFLKEMLIWDKKKKTFEKIIYNFFLLLALFVIILVTILSLNRLTDKIIRFVTAPGYLVGILLIWIYIIGKNRNKEHRLINSIFRKLKQWDSKN